MAASVSGHSKDSATRNMSVWRVFKYADCVDMLAMALGTLGSIGDGLLMPCMGVILSRFFNTVGIGSSHKGGDYMSHINKEVRYCMYLGGGVWIAAFLEAFSWSRTAERQASQMRVKYLRAVLRQDAEFFDTKGTDTAEVVNSVSNDTLIIQDVLSEKVPYFIMNMTTFIGSYGASFYLSWRLTLVTLPLVTLLIIPGFIYGKILMRLAANMRTLNNRAATIVEQGLSSIRTVYSFVGEHNVMRNYSSGMDEIVKLGIKQGVAKGLAIGSSGFTFIIWACISWYGSSLVMSHAASGGRIMAIGMLVTNGGMSLAIALPNLKSFSEAANAAFHISEMIDKVPGIDIANMGGKILETVTGEVQFRNVQFAYPSRPETMIFKKFSLSVCAGQTTALVGASGSGKSTAISLLERFYDPTTGEILLDGVNIHCLQLKWLRSQIGLVSQEPTLFATSIQENISFGKENASMEEITSAAKASDAHNFIIQLPHGYNTQVGKGGMQLSGGQKQRIAIARAVLKNPSILLLDEATSALDAESEKIVQDALNKASTGRTTIIVAHHLFNIHAAHKISVVQDGRVVESGAHEELMQKSEGAYASLFKMQQQMVMKDKTDNNCAGSGQNLTQGISSSRHIESRLHKLDASVKSMSTLEKEEPSQNAETLQKAPSFHRLLALNAPEWKHAIMGCLGAIGYVALYPAQSITMASMMTVLFLEDHDEIRHKIRIYSIVFMMMTVWSFLVNVIEHYDFAVMGEFLTRRVRLKMLSKILTFEVGWFDMGPNSSGAVCSRLSREANMVRFLVGDRLSFMVEVLSAVIITLAVALAVAWRFAIVMIVVQPVLIYCYYSRKFLLKQISQKSIEAQDRSSQVAAECVVNHKTIASFCAEEGILQLFESTQEGPRKAIKRQSWYAGLVLGTSQFIMTCQWALSLWYGGKLVQQGYISFQGYFTCQTTLSRTGRIIADAASMTSDIVKGYDAVKSVFAILDRDSSMNPQEFGALKLHKIDGNVEFKDVDFAYPARPDITVLKNFSLDIKAGNSMALVGKSGCGKSTIFALLERFYDPLKGMVLIDHTNIKTFNLRSLRHFIGLVGQEPTLFAGSIRDNIVYGKEDATETEVIEAAKVANAHQFISCLENGYNTDAGDRGLQLSGGQKQRIAIARAVIKNPSILLLDEATSALDAQSEVVVQEALDRIMVGRTSIIIAHRLNTIQQADCIAVIEDGKIVEQGSPSLLMKKPESSAYFRLKTPGAL